MTREEHLKFCKKCDHRVFEMQSGLLCNLTGKKADFEGECESFVRDEAVVEYYDDELAIERTTVLETLSPNNISMFQAEQDFPKAIIVGIVAGIIGALLWGIVTVTTGFQIGYMAIAIGAGVGFSIRFIGKGIDQKFGIAGGVIAFLSCFLGNIFSVIGFVASTEHMTYLEVYNLIGIIDLVTVMIEGFDIMDLVFYGIAAYEGYKFSFRSLT